MKIPVSNLSSSDIGQTISFVSQMGYRDEEDTFHVGTIIGIAIGKKTGRVKINVSTGHTLTLPRTQTIDVGAVEAVERWFEIQHGAKT